MAKGDILETNTGTGRTASFGSTPASGELLLIAFSSYFDTDTLSLSGFTEQGRPAVAFRGTVGVFAKVADGSESNSYYVSGSTVSGNTLWAAIRIEGSFANLDDVSGYESSGGGNPVTIPASAQSVAAGDLSIVFVTGRYIGAPGTYTYTAGYTANSLIHTTAGNGMPLGSATLVHGSLGTTQTVADAGGGNSIGVLVNIAGLSSPTGPTANETALWRRRIG
jgi:hypothetical protein